MIDRGKLVILFIFGLALSATAFSWWYHTQRGDRALLFWGRQAAMKIRHAPQVELLQIDRAENVTPTGEREVVPIGGRDYCVKDRRDISKVPGMLHARQALIEDASFAWGESPDGREPDWQFVLVFSERGEQAIIALDSDCQHVRQCPSDGQASLRPIASGMRTFIAEQLQGD